MGNNIMKCDSKAIATWDRIFDYFFSGVNAFDPDNGDYTSIRLDKSLYPWMNKDRRNETFGTIWDPLKTLTPRFLTMYDKDPALINHITYSGYDYDLKYNGDLIDNPFTQSVAMYKVYLERIVPQSSEETYNFPFIIEIKGLNGEEKTRFMQIFGAGIVVYGNNFSISVSEGEQVGVRQTDGVGYRSNNKYTKEIKILTHSSYNFSVKIVIKTEHGDIHEGTSYTSGGVGEVILTSDNEISPANRIKNMRVILTNITY